MPELIYVLTTIYGLYVIDKIVGDKLVLFFAVTALVIGVIH